MNASPAFNSSFAFGYLTTSNWNIFTQALWQRLSFIYPRCFSGKQARSKQSAVQSVQWYDIELNCCVWWKMFRLAVPCCERRDTQTNIHTQIHTHNHIHTNTHTHTHTHTQWHMPTNMPTRTHVLAGEHTALSNPPWVPAKLSMQGPSLWTAQTGGPKWAQSPLHMLLAADNASGNGSLGPTSHSSNFLGEFLTLKSNFNLFHQPHENENTKKVNLLENITGWDGVRFPSQRLWVGSPVYTACLKTSLSKTTVTPPVLWCHASEFTASHFAWNCQ